MITYKKCSTREIIVPILINSMIYDLICLEGIWFGRRGRLLSQLEEMWVTYTTQRTGKDPVGWHQTSIYEYKSWRWAAILDNFFFNSAVQKPLLLFVLGLNAICTFVLYYCHMQLICLPDLWFFGPLIRRSTVEKMTGNLKFTERQLYVWQARGIVGKSCWHKILWRIKMPRSDKILLVN